MVSPTDPMHFQAEGNVRTSSPVAPQPSVVPRLHSHPVSLVSVVIGLYLTLIHVTSASSLPLAHYGFSSRLQLSGYSPSASVFSLSACTTISDLTISKFISRTTNLRKQIEQHNN
jgi:hypothetical protein